MHFSATYASFNANRPIRKDTVWKNEKFTLTQKLIRQINSFGKYVRTNVAFMIFFQKSVRVNFLNFHTV